MGYFQLHIFSPWGNMRRKQSAIWRRRRFRRVLPAMYHIYNSNHLSRLLQATHNQILYLNYCMANSFAQASVCFRAVQQMPKEYANGVTNVAEVHGRVSRAWRHS